MKKIALFLMVVITCMFIAGCAANVEEAEATELDFTVVPKEDIPKEFQEMINDKLEEEFALTYQDEGVLYVAKGYGKQPSGGYSVAVREFSASDAEVYFDSELISPKPGEAVNRMCTYPYIVIKTEDPDKNVIFK